MATLAVNVDHVATVRQARLTVEPDPVQAAKLAERAGCHGIIVHLREDRRHIQDHDVIRLRKSITTRLNLEMAATQEMIQIARRIRPDMVCLVPEKRAELTTEGGLDVVGKRRAIEKAVHLLGEKGIAVSLFIDPNRDQISAAQDAGAEYIEIHTGRYADATTERRRDGEFKKIIKAIDYAIASGLVVNAGHGLNYTNIQRLVPIKEINEFSIGHSIIARAVIVGIEQAVREMLEIIQC
ncbi:MAG: pyridoxine 5'-phosphate synthase [Desulfobacterota bacterium]|nr:pyridoxine 5'-phosphate synthase [Thermodesulfobacteriota bacterium]